MSLIHHATIAKAAKLGVVMTQDDATGVVLAHWPDKNKRAYSIAGQAPAVLEDMRAWQMIVREYPNLKVGQPYVKDGNYVWEIELRGKVVGEGGRLNDAFEDALDAISKPAKGKATKEEDDGDETDREESDEAEVEDEAEGATAFDKLMNAEDDEDEEDNGKSMVKKRYKRAYRPHKMTCGDEISSLLTAHVRVKTEDGWRVDRKKLVRFAKANGVWDERYDLLNIGSIRMNIGNRIRGLINKNPDYQIVWN